MTKATLEYTTGLAWHGQAAPPATLCTKLKHAENIYELLGLKQTDTNKVLWHQDSVMICV